MQQISIREIVRAGRLKARQRRVAIKVQDRAFVRPDGTWITHHTKGILHRMLSSAIIDLRTQGKASPDDARSIIDTARRYLAGQLPEYRQIPLP